MFQKKMIDEVHTIRVVQREFMSEIQRGKIDCAFHEDSIEVLSRQPYNQHTASTNPSANDRKRLHAKGKRNVGYPSAVLRDDSALKQHIFGKKFGFDILSEEIQLLIQAHAREQVAKTLAENKKKKQRETKARRKSLTQQTLNVKSNLKNNAKTKSTKNDRNTTSSQSGKLFDHILEISRIIIVLTIIFSIS